jgi:predicted AlkP superfamily pyrophosphatase or phosphodiesterase
VKRALAPLLAAGLLLAAPLYAKPPDLVLWITVDQLRGDMPWRFRDRFGDGGFRLLMDRGASFGNAHYRYSATLTGPGHATLSTGTGPPGHGIIANDWFDRELRREVNCAEDTAHPLIGEPAPSAEGRSPARLKGSTFADELVQARPGSRVFAVSLKDRGAIFMAGLKGKAYWYAKQDGRFVTSTWYHESYPEWMQRWNEADPAGRYRTRAWSLLQAPETYLYADQDDRWYEHTKGHLGRTFPHRLDQEEPGAYYATLRYTPMADELLLDFALTLMKAERVGQSGVTDMLAIGFSATDYIGHAFGPNSLEAEDNLLRLDRTLARLFERVDAQVGLANTLIVLSSDHGVSPIPEHMAERGFDAGRHQVTNFMAQANLMLQHQLGTTDELAIAFEKPGVYLDTAAITALGAESRQASQAVSALVASVPGFSLVAPSGQVAAGQLPAGLAARSMAAAFHPDHSGDVLVIQSPFWYLSETPDGDATTHGSPHPYDTYVPLMLAGPGIRQGIFNRRVEPRDIAPTLSTYLGIAAPSGSTGVVLSEALRR